MIMKVDFRENSQNFKAAFGEAYNTPDDNYLAGYNKGYDTGEAEGYNRGYSTGYDTGADEGYSKGYATGNDEGYLAGEQAGYAAGEADGKQSEYDLFWDTFQNNGKRTYYERAFADTVNGGRMWMYGKNYRPKYPMKPLNAMQMYEYARLPYNAIAEVDFSECKDFYLTFSYFAIVGNVFPPIDISSATRTQSMFGWATGIHEIEEIKVSATTPYQAIFNGTTNLKEVRFNGTIAQTGLNLKSCTQLSKASIENIISCLSDTTSNLTVTFSRAAVDIAFESNTGADNGALTPEWNALVASKPNWTIALA